MPKKDVGYMIKNINDKMKVAVSELQATCG